MVGVEAFKLFVANTARHGRNMVDVWLLDHRCHGCVYVAAFKLATAMFFPEFS